jgi:hypothetical protein
MRITGTFLDEISFDIPHQNWGREEWDLDFGAMKAMGIKRVILIRCANWYFMTYPSKILPKTGTYHRPPIDLIDLFLDLAEKHGLEFFAGTCHYHPGNCRVGWTTEDHRNEIAINKSIIQEIQDLYGHRKAFAGWYLTHEVRANDPGVIELFVEQGKFSKSLSGNKPTLISPYFAGVKGAEACGEKDMEVLTVPAHAQHWDKIFSQIAGAVDYVAFQDGHVDYPELADYLRVTKELANKYGITCWSNVESFDRDMPIRFFPVKWEKFLWKLESAEAAGIEEGITFEFSHFMSPNSCYLQAGGLYNRYCEYYGLPARARDFIRT